MRSLNVKDPEAHRLAQAIAQATGETMTRAVTEALRERYERLQRRDPETLAADIRAIAKRAAAHIKRPYMDHAELLYDERGLPKYEDLRKQSRKRIKASFRDPFGLGGLGDRLGETVGFRILDVEAHGASSLLYQSSTFPL